MNLLFSFGDYKMKNCTRFLVLLVVLFFTVSSFSDIQTTRLIGDKVNIREKPSLTSKVIATLPVNTEVSILETSAQNETISNYTAPWLKISFSQNGKSLQGYVWKGLTAKKVSDFDGATLLYGVESVKNDNEVYYQIRVIKKKKEIAKLVFKGVGSLTTYDELTLNNNKGIKGIKKIIYINYSDEMCAGAFGDVVVFWNGKKLFHAITLHHGFDAPMFYEESLIYPEDDKGKKGVVVWTAKGGEHNDDGTDTIDTDKKEEYVWTGTELKKK